MNTRYETHEIESFCGYCGERLPSGGDGLPAVCPACRARFGSAPRGGAAAAARAWPGMAAAVSAGLDALAAAPGYRDPVLAALLSIVLPGAGQVYNHQFLKGLLVFLTCWLVIPYLLGIIDAFVSARAQNRYQAAWRAPRW